MAVTSLYAELGNRWLTSVGKDAKPGDEVTLSVGPLLGGGEFTTYVLGEIQGKDRFGEPLFDLEADEQVVVLRSWGGRVTATRKEIDQVLEEAGWSAKTLSINGLTYRWTAFGHWALVREGE